ncbi:MAG TPA: aminotransferase class I/II-fold pyridoxal phosphate-dependent enzyme [Vicinamibacterales bacterium]|jgi:cystathionine beta-lyase/cystathionine gamma-synthase|nr:aminotransferase class I/II-fold pyridoxal phosphate-dependent enzyme [Vicinamibacterales bacterium]
MSKSERMTSGKTTRLIEKASAIVGQPEPLTIPIYETTTYVFDSAQEVVDFNEGRSSKYIYSRYGNPTVVSVEQQLAQLDEAESALLFGSGMGAAAAILIGCLQAGDEVVCAASIYGGTLHLLQDLLSKFAVRTRFVSLERLANPADVLTKETRLLWFESPTNPTLRCVDIAAVAAACRAADVTSVIDNTFASPVNQQPLALGVDIVMQSATKYLNGHSDVTGGVVTGSREWIDRVSVARRLVGAVMEAHAAYALGRGLKTLELRVARQNESAQRVAEFLSRDRRVSRVYYPGLPDHPDHAIAAKQMRGFGGMVCVDLDGRFDRAERVYDRVGVFRRATSLGGVESLVSMPILTSQWGCSDEQLAEAGVTKGMLRLSVGLEDPDDLIADLDQALASAL